MESERKSPLFLFHAWRLSLALCGLLKRRCQGLKMRICLPLAQINSTLKNFYLDSIVCIFLFFMMAIVCSLCWFLNRELRNICFVGFFRENSQKKTICIWSDAPSFSDQIMHSSGETGLLVSYTSNAQSILPQTIFGAQRSSTWNGWSWYIYQPPYWHHKTILKQRWDFSQVFQTNK